MLNLYEEQIVTAKKNETPMPENEAQKMLKKLSDNWCLVQGSEKIHAEYKFKNFKKALLFVNELGAIADAAMHHPDIELGWGYARLDIQTHSINGLHYADFVLAAKADHIYNNLFK